MKRRTGLYNAIVEYLEEFNDCKYCRECRRRMKVSYIDNEVIYKCCEWVTVIGSTGKRKDERSS